MNEQKNLLLAIVASLIILLIFQYLFPTEKKPAQETTKIEKTETIKDKFKVLPRVKVIENDQRIYLSNSSRIRGSISLKGARFDDIILKDYKEAINPEAKEVTLLSPKNTRNPYFIELGWMSQQSINLPNKDTIWELIGGKELGPESPISLKWKSPDGLEFFRKIEIDENFLISIEQKIINNSNKEISVTQYGRVNRTGTPKTSGFYILHEGPIGVLNDRLIEIDYDDLIDDGSKTFISKGGWVGITDKYWLAALIPDQSTRIEGGFKAILKNIERYQAQYTSGELILESGEKVTINSNIFVGAKEVNLLDKYSKSLSIEMFDRAVDFGWFYIITKPLFLLLHKLSGWFGNVGLSILALTVLIRILLFPLANKSFKSMSKMKILTPKMTEIRERYKNDKLKMQQEIMSLYKTEKVNPLSGCLPILVQIPIFFALYKVLFVTLETRHAPFYGWVKDLSAPDPTTIFNLFGLLNFNPPSFLMIGAWPLLMALTMYLQQKLNPAPPDPLQAKIMSFLPLMFLFLFATFPAGLVIYWTWNNILSIAQQWIIMKKTK
ncbi:MAG: membrane protein insertase YidC [Rhodobacteraceae bacterium]|nr:membrane protein insertase YidC [Paracoccaceae bacterium]OUU62518.1 MAG: membrane protein insertase YidC [Alphaproteobacteria bacterium TMED62]|tara:strand:+ start:1830 stop:3485 length:1656 start_codon:yes stop_codon:yes gene_type:complete